MKYPALKEQEMLKNIAAWVNFENIILNEISPSQW